MKRILLLTFIIFASLTTFAQDEVIRLWKDAEHMKGERTRLYVFRAPDSINTGVSIIVCPGGSYHHLGLRCEGFSSAKWLTQKGINVFVLRYRVSFNGYHHPAMIQDAQKALLYVRTHASTYNIDSQKIGIMGYSAGGHLALMAGAFYQKDFLAECGVLTRVSYKPNFVAAIYPVVSMQNDIGHEWSRESLLTKKYTQEQQDQFSMELQIPSTMPPVFLQASKDDSVVNCQNSIRLNKALLEKNIKTKFLLYDNGGHGYGMKDTDFTRATKWNEIFVDWLREIDILEVSNLKR
ncbi:MAG: alpha/beta hydrolase [Bacteroidales bacterium]|nr:alpha/beta hydrolase [Bacteroidales bacterium]